MSLCEAFAAIAELGNALGAGPLNKHVGCWRHQVDDQWHIEVNGHKTPMWTADGCCELQPFHCAVMFNGWPAGIINPRGGTIAAGDIANEDAFIAAVRSAALRETSAEKCPFDKDIIDIDVNDLCPVCGASSDQKCRLNSRGLSHVK